MEWLRKIWNVLSAPIRFDGRRWLQVAINFHILLFAILFVIFSVVEAIAFAEKLFK